MSETISKIGSWGNPMKVLDPLNLTGKLTGGLLGGAKAPSSTATTAITPPPPDYTTATTSQNVQQQADLLRQRQGRAANLFTGTSGVNNTPVGTKVLLGS